MLHTTRRWPGLLVLAVCLSSAVFAQEKSPSAPPAAAPAAEETALRALLDRFFAADTKPAAEELAVALLAAKSEEERKALLEAEKELVTPELVQALIGRGNGAYGVGAYAEALATHRLAQSIAEQIGDRAGMGAALMGIGNVHRLQGNYGQALQFYQQSLTRFEALGDRAGIARALNNIGNVRRLQGNYGEALELYQRSLTLAEALGNRVEIARALNNIGNVYRLQGNYRAGSWVLPEKPVTCRGTRRQAGVCPYTEQHRGCPSLARKLCGGPGVLPEEPDTA